MAENSENDSDISSEGSNKLRKNGMYTSHKVKRAPMTLELKLEKLAHDQFVSSGSLNEKNEIQDSKNQK